MAATLNYQAGVETNQIAVLVSRRDRIGALRLRCRFKRSGICRTRSR